LSRFLSLNLLLIGVPLAILAKLAGWSDIAVFTFSALAIVPLSSLIGSATETVAEETGPQIGGLLNATLGNAAELIITFFALQAGLIELVKASIVGSVLGNLLLVTGMSLLVGGFRHGTQTFDKRGVSTNTTLMILAFMALVIPTVFDTAVLGIGLGGGSSPYDPQRELLFSVGIASVMIVLYVMSVIFTIRNPFREAEEEAAEAENPPNIPHAVLILAGSTIAIVVMSELLVGAVEPVVKQIGLSEAFMGLILIPIIGNVAEHIVAVRFALQNRMNLSLTISFGSSLQIALFVAPVLVFIGLLFPQHLLLVFSRYELLALATASIAALLVSSDGESNWLEGAELLAVYIILAFAFYAIPSGL